LVIVICILYQNFCVSLLKREDRSPGNRFFSARFVTIIHTKRGCNHNAVKSN
jgi:hypothetical protein